MELLHNFVINTGVTLVNQTPLQRVWQTAVVDLAFKHEFLMHTVLAISAMHLAYLRPSESSSLSVIAAHHQDQGLNGFRSELQRFGQYNCDALFASSILVIFYIPASSGTSINENMTSSSFLADTLFGAIIDWIRLVQGCQYVITQGRGWLEQGPIKYLVPREAWYQSTEPTIEKSRNEDRYLASLERLWAPDTPASKERYNDKEIETYKDALTKLRQAFARMSIAESSAETCCWCTQEEETSLDKRVPRIVAGVLWMMLISDEFFGLLEQRKPIALILLAHNAIILKRTSNEWWNKAPAIKNITAVSSALPAEYHPWIEWPQHEVGYFIQNTKDMSQPA